MTFTKEQLQHIIETDHVQCGDASALARMALAGMEAEPVAWAHRLINKRNGVVHPWVYGSAEACPSEGDIFNIEVMPLYTAPPAPVSVPDEATPDNIDILASTYAPRGVTFQWDRDECNAAADSWNACRAAMLQGAEQQNRQQNIPENIPATQFKPVADLYGLTSPTGSETSFTFDAVEARDFIDGGWSCQEYVELERFQEAITNHTEDKLAMVDHSGDSNNMVESVTTANKLPDDFDFDRFNDVVWLEAVASNPHMHSLTTSTIAMVALELNRKLADCNSPVIPDGWVACSERMPDEGSKVIVFRPRAEESNDPPVKTATYKGGREYYHGFDCYCEPTHWM
uniref:DUF551 domain-containing protein n=1 Tax=Enterobacter asburiae TaxID=61645 RepID=UPI00157AC665